MKKTFVRIMVLAACAMLFSLAGCAGNQGASSASNSSESSSASQQAEAPAETPEPATSGSSILIAYYSATGNTEDVANDIAKATGANMFAIEPVTPYTADDLDWRNDDSRVTREHNDPSLRTVELSQVTPEDWDSYDTVFIGYPIWWGIAAWPVDGFVTGNDFTGKTVIPFCTSSSSGLGDSASLLAEAAGTGEWQEGMRFGSSATQAQVDEWLNALGY